jgi:orotate phosphoribosyltransferase
MRKPKYTRVELLLELTHAGMLQFGYFTDSFGAPAAPIQFHFSLLPSFPHLMAAVAEQFGWHLRTTTDETRLLATQRTIALGGVIATHTNIPLLYPQQNMQHIAAAFSIEGTADVENPIIMITDVLRDGEAELALHQHATRIGLPVQEVVAILDTGLARVDGFHSQFGVAALYTLVESIDWIEAEGWIPEGIAAAVRAWQAANS